MASLVAVGVDALPSSDGIVADQKAHAESNGPRSSPGSSASAGITIPRAESPVHAEDKNGDRVSDTFDHVMGSLDRSEEGVAGLTERISGMGFDMEPDARFSMGEYMTGIGGDGMASPARASEGMGSLLSLDDDRESFAPQRSSLSAFEGPDRESFAPARSSLDDVAGPRSSLENPFAGSERLSVDDADATKKYQTSPITITMGRKGSVDETVSTPENLVAFDDEKGLTGISNDWVNAAQTPAAKLEMAKRGGAAAVLTTPKQIKREQSKCDIAEVRAIWSKCCGSARRNSSESAVAGHQKEFQSDKKRDNTTRGMANELMMGRRTSQKISARDSPSVTMQRKHPMINSELEAVGL